MPLDLLITGLLPLAAELRLPHAERWIARADVARDAATSPEAWLARRFGLEDVPVAPVTLAADSAPEPGLWLRADPVHARVQGDTMALHGAAMLAIGRDEADALVATLQAHFAADGIAFRAPHPERWYVSVPEGEMPDTTSLVEALAGDVFRRLPVGGGRINWPAAMTEAQMMLAGHPVNVAREAEGRPPVNSVWFWGGGRLPAVQGSPYAQVYGHDAFVRGLASLAGIEPGELPQSLAAIALESTASTLVVLAADEAIDERWFAPLGATLARAGTIRVVLPAASGTVVATIGPAARWRLWRSAKPLASYA